jgi:hypothetical protein
MKSIQSTSVGHTHDNIFDFIFCSDFDHFSKGRCEGIEALNTESFKVGKFGNEEINKALIPAEPFESVDPLFFGGFKDFKTLNSSFDKGLEKISFLFTFQMHVLIPDFIHVSVSEVVLHGLNGVRAVFFVGILLSEVFEDDLVLKVVF